MPKNSLFFTPWIWIRTAILIFISLPAFALDSKVCWHDIGDGYLSEYYKSRMDEQRKTLEPLAKSVTFSLTRTEFKFTLHLKNGTQKIFRSFPCDGGMQARFRTFIPALNTFVVEVRTGNGEQFTLYLIDRDTGKTTELSNKSIPLLSPDHKHFAVYGENYAYADNEVQIWRISPQGFQNIWAEEPEYGLYIHRGVRWLSNSRLHVTVSPDGDENGNIRLPKKLSIDNGMTVTFSRQPKS